MASGIQPKVLGPTPARRRRRGRRTRLLTRLLPAALVLVVVLGAAIALIIYATGSGGRAERSLVQRYVDAWSDRRWSTMYALLAPDSSSAVSEATFTADFTTAEQTATATKITFGQRIVLHGTTAEVDATIQTREFGTLHELALITLDSDRKHFSFTSDMVFPGLRGTETLTRETELGSRGTIEASDGTILAQGADRTSDDSTVSAEIVGSLESIPADQQSYYASLGYPADAQVGKDGLELIYQKQLAGTPGGTLLAGSRVLAHRAPINGTTVRSTINPSLETDAINILGGSYSGMTVLNIRTGAVEAAAGQAFTDVQPPGSTFKIITAAAALQDAIATPDTIYPYETETSVGGFMMQNAGGESCGGSLTAAFASSCDTTFAPLGISIGGKRLVAMAQRFGFNQATDIPSALESTIPSAATIGGDTAVGSTAIGQGQLEATTLEIADVGATIANGGRRPVPTFYAGAEPRYVNAVSPKVAKEVEAMMQAVVSDGTGNTAQISGYEVAGKTGTAELADTSDQQNDVKNTDAWFVGYVPDSKAGIVVCALYPANGYGADSAAPAVRQMLEDALGLG